MSNQKIKELSDLVGELDAPGVSSSKGRKVYFVRHGTTKWNKELRYQGTSDIPLSKEGVEQAALTGMRFAFLKDEPVKIVTSPLIRSTATANIIEKKLSHAKIEVWENLTEIDFGKWEGLTALEITEKFGFELFDKWVNAQLEVEVPGGEPCHAFFQRAVKVANELLNSSEKNIIVVGHGALFRTLFLPLLNQPKSNVFWKMRLDNCSVSGMKINNDKNATMIFYNDIMHLKVKDSLISKLAFL